jgi:hypothetical protein
VVSIATHLFIPNTHWIGDRSAKQKCMAQLKVMSQKAVRQMEKKDFRRTTTETECDRMTTRILTHKGDLDSPDGNEK